MFGVQVCSNIKFCIIVKQDFTCKITGYNAQSALNLANV